MGIFRLVARVIPPVTSQLTIVFSILSDLQTEAVKPFVKNGLNKSVTSSWTIQQVNVTEVEVSVKIEQ